MDQRAEETTFTILFQDDVLVAVQKPAGWAVHPGWAPKERSMLSPLKEQIGAYLYPVHRLDRGTSGVVLFALTKDAARDLNGQFQARSIQKRYLGWTRGHPKTEQGWIDYAIPRREGGARVPAQTAWRRLAALSTEPRETSLLALAPRTGRMHQIRRHVRHLNHPLLGDSRYGRPRLNRAFRKRYGLKRLALHAWALECVHPVSGEALRVVAPLADSLARPLAGAGFILEAELDPWSLLFPQHEETGSAVSLHQDEDLG